MSHVVEVTQYDWIPYVSFVDVDSQGVLIAFSFAGAKMRPGSIGRSLYQGATWTVPNSHKAGTDITFSSRYIQSAAGTGNISLTLNHNFRAIGEVVSSGSGFSTPAFSVPGTIYETFEYENVLSGASGGDQMTQNIERRSHASDTFGGNVTFLGVHITYTATFGIS